MEEERQRAPFDSMESRAEWRMNWNFVELLRDEVESKLVASEEESVGVVEGFTSRGVKSFGGGC